MAVARPNMEIAELREVMRQQQLQLDALLKRIGSSGHNDQRRATARPQRFQHDGISRFSTGDQNQPSRSTIRTGPRTFGRTPEELQGLQSADPVIGPFLHHWRRGRMPPKEERSREGAEFRQLVGQWGRIREKEGVLYRRWIKPGEGREMLQLILPLCLREEVLHSLHDNNGQPGSERTATRVRQSCYWPRMYHHIQQFSQDRNRGEGEVQDGLQVKRLPSSNQAPVLYTSNTSQPEKGAEELPAGPSNSSHRGRVGNLPTSQASQEPPKHTSLAGACGQSVQRTVRSTAGQYTNPFICW